MCEKVYEISMEVLDRSILIFQAETQTFLKVISSTCFTNWLLFFDDG